jgi:uncharacterized LabA/DUF88 family protein
MDARYLFIDGSYAREIYRGAMERVFGTYGEMLPGHIAQQINPFRTFFYDCVDDVRRQGESEADFGARIRDQ